MKFMLEIRTDNAVYEDDYIDEVIRNLRGVISKLDCSELEGIIHDTNGNKVGKFYSVEGE